MKFKIDTKEKFHVITVENEVLAANVTEEISGELIKFLTDAIKNIIVNLSNVQEINEVAAQALVEVQEKFYDENASMVICCLKPEVESFLDEKELLEIMNTTPTESEAWDIVQLEEIEREFS